MKGLKKNEKGFTLVELVVVIAILAVLVTLVVPKIMGNIADAKEQTEVANARTLASEITVFNARHDSGDWVKDSDSDGVLEQTDYTTAGLTLSDGTTWPTGEFAEIVIDGEGNATVNIP